MFLGEPCPFLPINWLGKAQPLVEGKEVGVGGFGEHKGIVICLPILNDVLDQLRGQALFLVVRMGAHPIQIGDGQGAIVLLGGGSIVSEEEGGRRNDVPILFQHVGSGKRKTLLKKEIQEVEIVRKTQLPKLQQGCCVFGSCNADREAVIRLRRFHQPILGV